MQPEARSSAPIVRLRPVQPGDAVLLDRWRQETEVRRYQPLSESSVAQLYAELAQQRSEDLYAGRGEKYQWVILADDRPAGWITLVITNWTHGLAELGYALSTSYQRRGVMPLALQLLLSDLFSNTRLRRIEARCAVENVASQKVLERLGFEREGKLRRYFVLRGRPVDNYLYAVLRDG